MAYNPKILVVDDELIIAEDLQIKLKNMGYSVPAIVSSGEEAITKVKEINPDLILMDIVIQGKMDGIETVEKIHTFSDVPVIYLTAYSDQNTLERAKLSEPFGYINKPYNERDIRANIEIALYKHKMERELKDRELRFYESEKLVQIRRLEESEEKYRELFENANDAMYTQDLEGHILTLNDAVLKIMDCTREEIIGSNFAEWITPDALIIGQDILERTMSGEVITKPTRIKLVTKKGENRWGEFTIRLIKNNDKITGIHGIGRDITEKERLEQELKESEAKYRDLFENALDAMFVTDVNINFLKVNKTGLKLLGCTREEIIGTNISKWVTSETMRIIQERQEKRLKGDKVNPTEILEMVAKNNEHRWVEITTRIIKSEDGEKNIHGIARDITENRLLKQKLNKSNKQQQLLCHLLQGTRGGKTRALILKLLSDKSYNANQLSTALNMDYKTIRHHLNVLIKNGIIGKVNDVSFESYFILNDMDMNINGSNFPF